MSAGVVSRRNDPCPCGSGRRYKHCHGALNAADAELERAIAQRDAGDFAGALAAIDAALANAPDHARLLNIQGLLRMELHDLDGALASLRRAIEASADFADAHFNLGILHLVRGEYAEGWREYAWRTRRPGYADYANYPFGIPRWNGEPLVGKRILVHAEQGFGDTLQCARFLTRLAGDGAEVEVFCQPALVALMQRIRGVSRALGSLAERPTHDLHAPIIDLAAHYLPSSDKPRWDGPYVAALDERVAQWRPVLESGPRPIVGFAWKGSAAQVNDRMRSLSPELAAELSRRAPEATFVNLVPGEAPPGDGRWVDAAPRLRDWDDTAAILALADLVIGVDTAVVHLAGAMGRPVWTLRAFMPDWRWGASGEATPWYPSMRLLRQPAPGDWETVVRAAAESLGRLRCP